MISIDVGSDKIRIIDVKVGSRSAQINKSYEIVTSGDFMNSDFTLDHALFKNAIKESLAKITSKDVAITFSFLPHVSNLLVLPYQAKESVMRETVKSIVFQTLSPSEYLMDYRIVREFEEEGVKKCSALVFMAPRKLVKDTLDCLESLGKAPRVFSVAQNSIYNFASVFLKGEAIIVAYVGQNGIDAHLINFPDNVIARTVSFERSKEMDILSGISEMQGDKASSLAEVVSKLHQYQSIKFPQRPIEVCYLMGDAADDRCKAEAEVIGIPTYLISELGLSIEADPQDVNKLVYAIGACIDTGVKKREN